MRLFPTLIRVEKAININDNEYSLEFVLPGWDHKQKIVRNFTILNIDIIDKLKNISEEYNFRGIVDVNLDVEIIDDLKIYNLREVEKNA